MNNIHMPQMAMGSKMQLSLLGDLGLPGIADISAPIELVRV